jgi:hypothetical protein
MNKRNKWRLLILLSLGIGLCWGIDRYSLAETTETEIRYTVDRQPNRIVHTVFIPHNGNYSITPVVAPELTTVENLANSNQAIAAINGGYFDPKNQKTTSYIVRQGKLVADPRTNERLIDNPDLKPYLGKILNRSEFRTYLCGKEISHDITLQSAPVPANCQLEYSLGGGPGLLPQDTSIAEGFTAYQDGTKIRDAIGNDSPNARSAIALTQAGDIILVMVEQTPNNPQNSGLSVPDLARFLTSLGAEKAMNLDGGSSSALYYRETTVYGRIDREGNKIQRPIKSILSVTENKS